MELKILGQKVRLEIIALCLLLGYLIGCFMLCSCSKISMIEGMKLLKEVKKKGIKKSIKEGLELSPKEEMTVLGTDINWKMGDGVPGSWDNSQHTNPLQQQQNTGLYSKLEGNVAPEPYSQIDSGSLDFLSGNKFDAKCCPATYTSSTGCACLSVEQAKYLNERGGNRTLSSMY